MELTKSVTYSFFFLLIKCDIFLWIKRTNLCSPKKRTNLWIWTEREDQRFYQCYVFARTRVIIGEFHWHWHWPVDTWYVFVRWDFLVTATCDHVQFNTACRFFYLFLLLLFNKWSIFFTYYLILINRWLSLVMYNCR